MIFHERRSPVLFNVAGLLQARAGATKTFDISIGRLSTVDGPINDVFGQVKLMRTDSTILVSAHLRAIMDAQCARCAEQATVDLAILIEEEFQPTNIDLGRGKRKENAHDDCFRIGRDNILDLSEAIRQTAAGAMPIAAMCRGNCLGLCTSCAANRNISHCNCDEMIGDPRWQPLDVMGLHDRQ